MEREVYHSIVMSPGVRRLFGLRMQRILLLVLLAISVLWRGGKSLDITWLLAGAAGYLVVAAFLTREDHQGTQPLGGAFPSGGDVPRPLWLVVMGFVLLTAVSYVFSSTRNYGLDEVLQTASLALIFFWTVRNNFQFSILNFQFSRVLVWLTVASCVVGVFVYVLQPVDRFVGTFFDYRFHTDYWPNAYAEFLLLAWPVVEYHAVRNTYQGNEGFSLRRTPPYLLLGFILGLLLLTYSRGALIAFGGQIVLLALLSGPSVPSLRSFLPKLVGSVVVAFLTFFAINALRSSFFPVQSVVEKVTFTAAEGGSSIAERRQFFAQAVSLAAEKPLLGWGPYSFRFVQPRLQTGVLETSDHPHNVFLKFAMERGVPAAILFAVIVGYVLYGGLRPPKFEIRNSKFEVLATVAASGVLAHNLIDYNLQFTGVALPTFLLLGFLVPPDARPEGSLGGRGRRFWEFALAVTVLLVSFREGAFLVTSSLGRAAETRGDTEMALQWYRRSRGEWFSRDLLLSEGIELLFVRGDADGAASSFLDYLEVNDEDTRGHRLLGDALSRQGNLRRAEEEYRRAYDLGKWNDLSSVKALLLLYLQSGNTTAIDAWREELTALLQSYRDAIARNSHYIALGPNPEALLDILQILRGIYPDDDRTIGMWMEEVRKEAGEERERLKSRGPGWLW
jgi:O-antigen ligase